MAKIKKSVSVLLAVSMVFSMFTVVTLTASAEETDDLTYHNGDNVYVGDLNIGDVVDKGVILRSWSSSDQTHYSSFRVECDGVYWTDGGNTVTEFTTDRSVVLTSASDSENYVSPTKIYKERNLSFRSVFRSWAELKETVESVSDGSRQYIIDYDLTALDTDTAITIPSGASVTIDLNGHTLDRGLTSLVKDGGSAFWVPSGASLTITDSSEAHSGVITGGYGNYGGGIENYGTVNLYGGTVTGNSAVYGGGIYSDGELHIKGHIIVENNQDFDIYLTADKRLILDGTLDLREGNQPFIGVYSEGDPHNFTSNYSTYLSDTWPDEVFFGNAATVAHTYDSGEAWYSDYQIAYLDRTWNSEKNEVEEQLKSVSGCTILNNQPDINNLNLYGWYAVTSSDTFSHPINITGDCNLILCDGVKLTCNKGILVSEGVTLNIYGQKLGTGELYAETPSDNSAAIGGGAGDFGVINFRGGKIEAKARYNISRGIGFRTSDGGASVNFYGGEVKAYPNPAQGTLQGYSISGVLATNVAIYGGDLDITAGTDNPGIGAKGTIRICGGHVKAKGSYQVDSSGNETNKYSGAGIDGTVEISGGVVEAYGTANGAGIGGSFANNNITYAGNITITGGTVTAVGGIYGAGIGGNGITYPNPLREQIITITGGTVTATGGSQGGAGIGGNSYQDVSNSRRYTGGSTVIITGGDVTAFASATEGDAVSIGNGRTYSGDETVKGALTVSNMAVEAGSSADSSTRITSNKVSTIQQSRYAHLSPCDHADIEATFHWADDNSSATLSYSCSNCGDEGTVDATVTSEVITPMTDDQDGETKYTAAATIFGTEYTDEKTVTIERPNTFTITWMSFDGSLLKEEIVNRGDVPEYEDEVFYYRYGDDLLGWSDGVNIYDDDNLPPATKDTAYTAVLKREISVTVDFGEGHEDFVDYWWNHLWQSDGYERDGVRITYWVNEGMTVGQAKEEFDIRAGMTSDPDNGKLFAGEIGTKTMDQYADYEAFRSDTQTVLGNGAVLYALWLSPVDTVAVTLEPPVDGTTVTVDADLNTQNPEPEASVEGNASLYSKNWVTGDALENMQNFSGAFVKGESYKALVSIEPAFGYYYDGNQAVTLNGETAALLSSLNPNRLFILGTMQAVNNHGTHLAGHSISLDGDIGVNFYMELSESVIEHKDTAYMHFTIPVGNGTTEQDMLVKDALIKEWNGKDYYVFKCRTAAKEMTSQIKAQIIDGNESGVVYSYSVKEYADYLLAHANERDDFKRAAPLVKAMLNYGAYAQIYFDKNPNNLANADLIEADKTLGEVTISEPQTVFALPESVTFAGSTLSLKSETTLSLYFTGDQFENVTCVDKEENVRTFEITSSGNYQVVRIKNIAAKELKDSFTVKFTVGGAEYSVVYSPMNYCYNALNGGTSDANLQNVIKVLYLYSQAANDYFN